MLGIDGEIPADVLMGEVFSPNFPCASSPLPSRQREGAEPKLAGGPAPRLSLPSPAPHPVSQEPCLHPPQLSGSRGQGQHTLLAGGPPTIQGVPGGSAGKESACNAGDLGSIPGLGGFAGEKNNYPLQHSGLENSMDCIVPGVTELDTTE